MRRAWAVAVKELRQIGRDRRTSLVLLFLPAFFLFLYGYALNFDIRHVSLAVEDRDGSLESRQLVASFVRSTYFDQVATVRSDAEINELIDHGRVRAVLVIPEDFSRRLRSLAISISSNRSSATRAIPRCPRTTPRWMSGSGPGTPAASSSPRTSPR